MLAALFATATRGAVIVLVFGFLYMTFSTQKAVPRAALFRVGFIAIAVFYLALGLVEPLVSHMMDRIANIGLGDASVQHRSVVLKEAWHAIPDSPFIGHGLGVPHGTFRGAVSMNIHNLYLTLAYALGIPGLVAFLWFMVRMLKLSWEGVQARHLPPRLRELNLVLHTMLVMFLVDEVKIEFIRQAMYMHMTWLWFAWVVVSWRIGQQYLGDESMEPSAMESMELELPGQPARPARARVRLARPQ